MAKVLIIEKCNYCHYFSSYAEGCFHPKVVKPHKEGKVSRNIQYEDFSNIEIPKWCPLEDSKEEK